MAKVFFTIGGNIGDRMRSIQETRELIGARIGSIRRQSAIYESEPWGFSSEFNFLNQVVEVETSLSLAAIMLEISYIESKLGRVRDGSGYSSRVMDIDILFYDHQVVLTSDLTVPHKQMHKRRFVLVPLNEIAPEFLHPLFSCTVRELLVTCTDTLKVWRYEPAEVSN